MTSVLLLAHSAGAACTPSDGPFANSYPLQSNLGSHHLVDASGKPFFMQGDSAWSLIAGLSYEDADRYLADRRARGFNTLLVNLIEHRFTPNAPANAYGERPFLVDHDFTTPNPAYFDHAARVIERACELGFVVLLAPSYLGYGGGGDGWYAEMALNGIEKLHAYGRFVGARFKQSPNLVWVQGGDYDPPDRDLVRAVSAGISETDPGAIHTVHGSPETRPLDYWPSEPWLAINNVYTYEDVGTAALEEWEVDPARPFFLMESFYENERRGDPRRVRSQAYNALLAGATGQIYGNNPIWHFNGPGLYPVARSWQEELDSVGARSMTALRHLVDSIEWWRLQPDLSGTVLVRGRGWYGERAAAAAADDGSFALVYLPDARGVTVDLRQLSGAAVTAEWRDPLTGATVPISGSPFAPGQYFFFPRGKNEGGDGDWLLVLTAAEASAAASQ